MAAPPTTGPPRPDGVRDAPTPASQQTVRRHNRALVLQAIAARPGRSRAQLAAVTGMSRATVSALVDELLAGGLVRESDADRGARGRPAVPLLLDPQGPAGLGIEVNVDYTAVCVVDLTGRVRGRRTVLSGHRASTPEQVLSAALDLATGLVDGSGLPLAGAAVAVPGLVDGDGRVRRLPNLPGWEDLDCGGWLRARLGVATRVDNEANLAAVAEARSGQHGGDFLLVSGEIGVGTGVMVGGALYRGVHGFAGELGHVVVDPAGPRCGCGARGCLEQYVGQEALLRAAGLTGDVATATAAPDGAAAALVGAARRGDPRTLAALAGAGRTLGVALAGALNLLDVPTVVLGGLYARLAPWLGDPVGAELDRRTISRGLSRIRVLTSSLGADAAVVGAAHSVVDEVVAGGCAPGTAGG